MNLALLIASIAASVLQGDPNIPAKISTTISAIASALSALAKSGVTSSISATTVLAAIAGVIAALKATPNLPQHTLDIIADLDAAVVAALAADKFALAGPVDPSQVQPIQPLP